MKGILLVSHGKLAEGMKDTLKLFSGEIEQLDSLVLDAGQEIEEFGGILKNKVDQLDTGEGVVIFCDLAFGTPANVSGQLLGQDDYKDRVNIITGMNLPMLLEYSETRKSNAEMSSVVQIGKDGIIDFNDRLKNR